MTKKKIIDFGPGKIKSDMIDSFYEDFFKKIAPGSLIITEDPTQSITVLSITSSITPWSIKPSLQICAITSNNREILCTITFMSEYDSFVVIHMFIPAGMNSKAIQKIVDIIPKQW